MNLLSEEQAATRQLRLLPSDLLESLSPPFIEQLQAAGAFVEYNQQAVVSTGQVMDYVSCILAGRVQVSRVDRAYTKVPIATLSAGEWFGETNLFLCVPSADEIFADGEVIIWRISSEMMRNLCFSGTEGARLLFNVGTLLARRILPTGVPWPGPSRSS